MASIAMADMAHSLLKQVRAANDLPETVSAVVVAAMQLLVHHSQVPAAPGGLLASDRRLSDVTEGPNEELRRTSAEDPESNRRLSEVTEAKEEREGGDLRI